MDLISLLAETIKDAPELIAAFKSALSKRGYTNEEIDGIFADVLPREQLGIDPLHPFAPDAPAATAAAPAALPVAHTQAQISQAQPFIHAVTVPLPELAASEPAKQPVSATPAVTPPPVPFERAR